MQIAPRTTRRPAALVAATAAGFGSFAQTASAGAILPDKGVSPGAQTSVTLVITLLIVATIVLIGVVVLLLAGLRRPSGNLLRLGGSRAKAGGLVAFVALVAIGTASFLSSVQPDTATAKLGLADYQPLAAGDPQSPSATLRNPRDLTAPSGDYLRVYADAQRYLWRYTYIVGQPIYAYQTLVVPTGIPVLLDVTSSDVVHSWWVPQVGGKFDAVPGYVNQAWIKIDTPGTYLGSSAGISGVNYASETIKVKAVKPAEFAKWITKQKADLAAAGTELTKSRAAGTTGATGATPAQGAVK